MDSKQMHVCRLCDKLLSSSSSLDRHMLTHSGERPFVCKRCQMTFTTNGNMHRHMRTHLHKDSLARQQQEQQLKSLVGGSSLPPTSSPATTVAAQQTATNTLGHQLAPNQICDPASMAAAAAAAAAMAGRPFVHMTDHNTDSQTAAMSHRHHHHHHHQQQQHHHHQQQQQQQDTTSSVTALLNQQLVAALKKQQQIPPQTPNRANTSSSCNSNRLPTSTLHLDTSATPTTNATAADQHQLFRNTLIGVQDLVQSISPTAPHNGTNSTLASNMAPENQAAANFLSQQQLDPKALMMGALQGDQLESVKAVMLAAAAAAAAAASQQQQQNHHHNHHHQHQKLLQSNQFGTNRSAADCDQQLLMQTKRETSSMDVGSLDQQANKPESGALSPARHRLREKRRKQINPRCSTRPNHLSTASLNGDDSGDDSRRSSESTSGQLNEESLSNRLRGNNEDDDDVDLNEDDDDDDCGDVDRESIASAISSTGRQCNRDQKLLSSASKDNTNVDDDESTDEGEQDDVDGQDEVSEDANNNDQDASKSAATAIKREDFNNNDRVAGEENIDRHKLKKEAPLLVDDDDDDDDDDAASMQQVNNDSADQHDETGSRTDEDEDQYEDDEDQELENEDDERQFNAATVRLNMSSSIINSDDEASLGSSGVNISMSDNNNSSQMQFTPRTNSDSDIHSSNQQQNHSIRQNSTSDRGSNNNFGNHFQSSLDQLHQQNQSLSNTLNTINGEVIEDISQSYVKTTNPNAARKGGKRNRHCYKCKLCTYSSVDRCTLVRHLRIHSGERPYICGICRYAFTTKANCERHVRKRHKKQYNSLGGAGGGGVKGSNGGGRSLIITDHSNHQTIPVKVNPAAAQTISQTLQRIQEKQQHQNINQNTMEDELDNIERIPNHQHSHFMQQKHVDTQRVNEQTSLTGYKSKRKHRGDERLDEASSYQRRRLMDSDGATRLSSRKNIINETQLTGSNLFNQQPGPFANTPEMPSTNELFVNLVAQLQQATGSHESPNVNGTTIGANMANLAQTTSQGQEANVTSATFLANMLAAGKNLSVDGQQGLSSSQSSLLSPKHLSQQLAQLRNLNSQAPFFIRRNPFDPFNPLDLAAQALDLSCKFQSSK